MIQFKREILEKLSLNKYDNFVESEIFMYNSKILQKEGKFFLIVYFFKTLPFRQIDNIKLKITANNQYFFVDIDYTVLSSNENETEYICTFEIPSTFAKSEYNIYIISTIIDKKFNEFSNKSSYKFDLSFMDNLPSNPLLENCYVMPRFEENYWICTCGKINSAKNQNCSNCEMSIQINRWLSLDNFKKNEIISKLKNSPICFNLNSSFKDNLRNYSEEQKRKIDFDILEILPLILNVGFIENEYNNAKLYSKNKKNKLMSKPKKNNRTNFIVLSILFLLIIFVALSSFYNNSYSYKYKLASDLQNNDRFIDAAQAFNEISEYKDSEKLFYYNLFLEARKKLNETGLNSEIRLKDDRVYSLDLIRKNLSDFNYDMSVLYSDIFWDIVLMGRFESMGGFFLEREKIDEDIWLSQNLIIEDFDYYQIRDNSILICMNNITSKNKCKKALEIRFLTNRIIVVDNILENSSFTLNKVD